MTVTLTSEQEVIIDMVEEWCLDHGGKQIKVMSGLAGTGKTTVLRSIINRVEEFMSVSVCAFSGKAVNVLHQKGIGSASTIHSLIYVPELDDDDRVIGWVRRDRLDCDLIIIDEASMVSKDLLIDLKSFGKLILCVGDHGQLPPVGNDPGIMRRPDFMLTEIHRQEEGNGIIDFAHRVRNGETSAEALMKNLTNDVFELAKNEIIPRYNEFDQVICAFNAVRQRLNKEIRAAEGFSGKPQVGEKMICLRNDRRQGIYNGMMGSIIEEDRDIYDIELDDGRVVSGLRFDVDALETGKSAFDAYNRNHHFTYGYAITVHKAQGSQWDNVLVVEGRTNNWDMNRWRYTAATRAAKKLGYIW